MTNFAKRVLISTAVSLFTASSAFAISIDFDFESGSVTNDGVTVSLVPSSFTEADAMEPGGVLLFNNIQYFATASQDESENYARTGTVSQNVSVTIGGITLTRSQAFNYTVQPFAKDTPEGLKFGGTLIAGPSSLSDPIFDFGELGTVVVMTPSFSVGTPDRFLSDSVNIADGAIKGVPYSYTPAPVVPLPAALPLLLAGITGLGLLRRRKTNAVAYK